MYAEVTLSVAVAHRIVKVPSTAIVFDAKGVHVAGLDDDNRVHLIVVQPGRDNGSDVGIVDGLVGGERISQRRRPTCSMGCSFSQSTADPPPLSPGSSRSADRPGQRRWR